MDKTVTEKNKGPHPFKISHFGLQTYDIPRLRDWYCKVLNGYVVVEFLPYFSTITFDDEHHRVAIAGVPGKPIEKNRAAAGIFHIALTMPNIFDLLTNYERVRDLGIVPETVLHHGPTVSMYYRDPDGNECELIVDCFKTGEETRNFMRGPVFAHTLGAGGNFDPEKMLARMKAGATEEELMFYDIEAAMKVDIKAELEEFHKSRLHVPQE